MTNSSTASKKQDRARRRFGAFLSPFSSTSAGHTDLTSANPPISQIIVSKPSASSASVQLSPQSAAVSQTAHSPPTSLPHLGRSILNKALKHLEQGDRTIVEAFISPNDEISSVLSTIYTACQRKGELCEKNSWTITLRGRTVKLRKEADKVIFWLDKFKQVGDIAANADPIHAGLPWAGIRLLLEVWESIIHVYNILEIA
jgi:hypothetical protein